MNAYKMEFTYDLIHRRLDIQKGESSDLDHNCMIFDTLLHRSEYYTIYLLESEIFTTDLFGRINNMTQFIQKLEDML